MCGLYLKKVGIRSMRLKYNMKKVKFDDVEALDGKGRLTDAEINKLQIYNISRPLKKALLM